MSLRKFPKRVHATSLSVGGYFGCRQSEASGNHCSTTNSVDQ
jgi:hypothetical protein